MKTPIKKTLFSLRCFPTSFVSNLRPCAEGAPFQKLVHGGGQEEGRRAGTENVLHIVGLGAACDLVEREASRLPAHLAAMRDALQETLSRQLGGEDGGGVRVNGGEKKKKS